MGTTTITDFSDLHWSRDELHAWALGDVAATEGVRRVANPYSPGDLYDAWDQGFLGFPLASPDAETVVIAMFGRHAQEAVSDAVMRTVPSLRAQCGSHRWATGRPCHAKPEVELDQAVA